MTVKAAPMRTRKVKDSTSRRKIDVSKKCHHRIGTDQGLDDNHFAVAERKEHRQHGSGIEDPGGK